MGILDKMKEKAEQVKEKADEIKDKAKVQIEKNKENKVKKEDAFSKEKEDGEKKLQAELQKAEKIIITTTNLDRNYEVVDICIGFAKDRSYISQYERGLAMLKYHAFKKGCDAVIGMQIQMMEGKESSTGGSLTGALLGAVTEKVLEEVVFVDQIPKDGAILFGTGVKFIK